MIKSASICFVFGIFCPIIIYGNEPPFVLNRIEFQSTLEETEFTYDLSDVFADVDGAILKFEAFTSQTNLEAKIKGSILAINPAKDWTGTATITVKAYDNTYNSVEEQFTLRVINVNDPPVFLRPYIDTAMKNNDTLFLNIVTNIFDVDNSVSELAITVDSIDGVYIEKIDSLILISPQTFIDTAKLKITVTDEGLLSASSMLKIYTNKPTALGNEFPVVNNFGNDSWAKREISEYSINEDGVLKIITQSFTTLFVDYYNRYGQKIVPTFKIITLDLLDSLYRDVFDRQSFPDSKENLMDFQYCKLGNYYLIAIYYSYIPSSYYDFWLCDSNLKVLKKYSSHNTGHSLYNLCASITDNHIFITNILHENEPNYFLQIYDLNLNKIDEHILNIPTKQRDIKKIIKQDTTLMFLYFDYFNNDQFISTYYLSTYSDKLDYISGPNLLIPYVVYDSLYPINAVKAYQLYEHQDFYILTFVRSHWRQQESPTSYAGGWNNLFIQKLNKDLNSISEQKVIGKEGAENRLRNILFLKDKMEIDWCQGCGLNILGSELPVFKQWYDFNLDSLSESKEAGFTRQAGNQYPLLNRLNDSLYININYKRDDLFRPLIYASFQRGMNDPLLKKNGLGRYTLKNKKNKHEDHIAFKLDKKDDYSVFVYNLQGRVVLKRFITNSNFVNLSISKFKQGIYFIKATSKDKIFTRKFFIK